MAFLVRSVPYAVAGLLAAGCLFLAPVAAQEFPIDPASPDRTSPQNEGLREVGRTAETGTGEVGRRQTAANAAPNVEPMGRVNSRIQNRVQNRLRNRIDRNYDPKANATAPFEVASEQAREASRSPR